MQGRSLGDVVSHETGRAKWLSTLGKSLGTDGPENPKHNSFGFGTASPTGRCSARVSLQSAERVVSKKVIACPLALGSEPVFYFCVCFSVTLRSGRVCFHNLSDNRHRSSALKPPHLTSTHTYCLFLSFTGEGLPLSPEEEKHMVHWIQANGHYPLRSVL